MLKKLTLLFTICLIAVSCFEEEPTIPMEDILGNWQGSDWLVKGQDAGRNASAVKFSFMADSTYTAAMGKQTEEGIFRLKGNKLYTTAKGDAEKSVELSTVNADSIVMRMNRQGEIETLILLKK